MDVEPTAQTISDAAKRFRHTAYALERVAEKMRERQDLSYAAEAISEILNALQNSRIDLMVTRPIRALENHE